MANPLVTTHWLQQHLTDSNLVLLDASMETVIGREPVVYDQLTLIPGSHRFDLEGALCNLDSAMVHAFPTEAQFNSAARRVGINADSTVVIYDNQGIYSAPRAWWICRAMGLDNVHVLDGGLPKWLAEDRPTAAGYADDATNPGTFQSQFRAALVCDSRHILANLENDAMTVLDARAPGRFQGKSPEPRPGVRGGHIPGSANLPFGDVLNGSCFKSSSELTPLFAALAAPGSNLVCSCGSGITACILLLAAELAGYASKTLYDGSWADWGSDEALPVGTA